MYQKYATSAYFVFKHWSTTKCLHNKNVTKIYQPILNIGLTPAQYVFYTYFFQG